MLDGGARVEPLAARRGDGYHRGGRRAGVAAGDRYRYRLDGARRRSPTRPRASSRRACTGRRRSSIPAAFAWTDAAWRGLPLRDLVIYELHVGTFTPEGTFDGVIAHLDELVELGVTAIELMPVAQFPGGRNWGYDGVVLFAAASTYGGPEGFGALVDACHARGLAVVLDVVYNHLGPEGNYPRDFGPYFTDRYRTPGASAVNVDGPRQRRGAPLPASRTP